MFAHQDKHFSFTRVPTGAAGPIKGTQFKECSKLSVIDWYVMVDLQTWKNRYPCGAVNALKVCCFSEEGASATALPYLHLSQAPQVIKDGF